MVSEKNQRIMITLPKKQVEWLKEYCKKNDFTPSTFIKYLLVKRVDDLYKILEAKNNTALIMEISRIAKTRWLYDDEPGKDQ